jgi:hypothetical protein
VKGERFVQKKLGVHGVIRGSPLAHKASADLVVLAVMFCTVPIYGHGENMKKVLLELGVLTNICPAFGGSEFV